MSTRVLVMLPQKSFVIAGAISQSNDEPLLRRVRDSDVEKSRSRLFRIGCITFQAIVEGLGGNT
jgi:hypothetical protein